jgi:hypothetical protein
MRSGSCGPAPAGRASGWSRSATSRDWQFDLGLGQRAGNQADGFARALHGRPPLPAEKNAELHGIRLGRETLRKSLWKNHCELFAFPSLISASTPFGADSGVSGGAVFSRMRLVLSISAP